MRDFLDTLRDAPLLFDGAMGTLLYDRGVMHTRSYDELNLSQPELVAQIHREYLDAGADILETNTFGANRLALAKHGFSDRAAEINAAGARIAREVAGSHAYVAGAIGPTGVKFAVAPDHQRRLALDALREQIEALAAAEVDLLLLETFTSILELEAAVALARAHGGGRPVGAQLVFGPDRRADGGLSPAEVAERLVAAGADFVGANCGAGPPELYDVAVAMVDCGKPVSVQPNAGLPSVIEGRTIYVANPEHFGVFARRLLKSGVKLVGGCCGTTPEHTRRMMGAVRMMGARPQSARLREAATRAAVAASPPKPAVPLAERSRLGARLAAGEFVVSVELNAPAGTDTTRVEAAVRELLAGGVDIVNIADGPRATARMGNLALCALLRQRTGVEPILHVCTRDRNFLGLVAHLLGAHALGMRDLVIITGDPPKMGDYPFATPVYDIDSIGLLKLARDLNAGIDPAGRALDGQTAFVLATGAEPGAADYERELRRLEAKVAAGAELVMTQPVYDARTLERFLDDVAPLGVPVMVGLLPLASHRNAEFLHTQVPGMSIPDAYRARMARVGSGPAARAEGVAIAREVLAAVKHRVAGAYIMPPFNRVDSALAILDEVRGDRWTPAPPPDRADA
ncbi:MAG: bifunctional homocysteine S-methyltransferase/methylenetetrahydrofolate reductase, partial [Deltaproteobacteria bacterium]